MSLLGTRTSSGVKVSSPSREWQLGYRLLLYCFTSELPRFQGRRYQRVTKDQDLQTDLIIWTEQLHGEFSQHRALGVNDLSNFPAYASISPRLSQ